MKTVLRSTDTEDQKKELNDIIAVVTTLRNFCQKAKNPTQAIKIISKKTGLSINRVEELVKQINR